MLELALGLAVVFSQADFVVAAACVFSSITGPLVMTWLIDRGRRKEKRLEWEHQGRLARSAASMAKVAQRNTEDNGRKLDVIHSLVNSNMTAMMQQAIDATARELALMEEVVDLKSTQGRQPSAETQDAISATRERLEELRAAMADRKRAQDDAEPY